MRSSRELGAAAVIGCALALGGCGDTVLVYQPRYSQVYESGDLEYAARSGELRTNVYGTPFPGAGDQVGAVTTADMKGANHGPEIIFTPKPKGKGSGEYHVVMLFNPVKWAAAPDICKGAAAYAAAPTKGRVWLLSAFCFADSLLSEASGSVGGVDSLEDPRFKDLVRQVTLALFPLSDFKDRGF